MAYNQPPYGGGGAPADPRYAPPPGAVPMPQSGHPQHQAGPPHGGPPEDGGGGSYTIDEMRTLHRSALSQADAKRTELRLVLASRYRELVGSSDEVTVMRERAEELGGLVSALPGLADRVVRGGGGGDRGENAAPRRLFGDGDDGGGAPAERPEKEGTGPAGDADGSAVASARAELSRLPREVHRRLDSDDVHGAASGLVSLFGVISSSSPGSDSFPLASALSPRTGGGSNVGNGTKTNRKGGGGASREERMLEAQTRMVYLHVQTLPSRTVKLARRRLLRPASDGGGARGTAAALSALDLLDAGRAGSAPGGGSANGAVGTSRPGDSDRAARLLDLYYASKAELLNGLLAKLTLPGAGRGHDADATISNAERVLGSIVTILQYDVILYPHMIFVLRRFPDRPAGADGSSATATNGEGPGDSSSIMSTLPPFDAESVRSRASRFLAAHLPLVRTKVKSVLMVIAGTTASRLGSIRQSLYDRTDGTESVRALDRAGGQRGAWDDAVAATVDVRTVGIGASFASSGEGSATAVNGTGGPAAVPGKQPGAAHPRRFSLWSALFSGTFGSLVHSLLTSSFTSVHVRSVSALRASLSRAPGHDAVLPHEARRNALRIATDLDAQLRRVSDDAHELLVHAEEREESERRLRQSLYVQTCEIMGRLLNELRRMLSSGPAVPGSGGRGDDATKVLIVGRLCHLLKFRLGSLPSLLDPGSSPSALGGSSSGGKGPGSAGTMITLTELGSSFDLADDDDDGLVSFDEAMEAMESAFSGTSFRGAEMVRDTLLLGQGGGPSGSGGPPSSGPYGKDAAPRNVTLSELALLSARGLRHDPTGPNSALGTVQRSLDGIVSRCFAEWSRAALAPALSSFRSGLGDAVASAGTSGDVEWRRTRGRAGGDDDGLLRDARDSGGDEGRMRAASGTSTPLPGDVSPYVVSYLLSASGVLNRSVCPADSLPPVPSAEFAERLGISSPGDGGGGEGGVANVMATVRGSLLGEAVESVSESLARELSPSDDGEDGTPADPLDGFSPSALAQFAVDVRFLRKCFFERSRRGLPRAGGEGDGDGDGPRRRMDSLIERLNSRVATAGADAPSFDSAVDERHAAVFASCDLYLSTLLGEDGGGALAAGPSAPSSSGTFLLSPLPSSRRFVLLPVQAGRSLSELRLRGKYGKNKPRDGEGGRDAGAGNNALGSGFGFLSSMLSAKR